MWFSQFDYGVFRILLTWLRHCVQSFSRPTLECFLYNIIWTNGFNWFQNYILLKIPKYTICLSVIKSLCLISTTCSFTHFEYNAFTVYTISLKFMFYLFTKTLLTKFDVEKTGKCQLVWLKPTHPLLAFFRHLFVIPLNWSLNVSMGISKICQWK